MLILVSMKSGNNVILSEKQKYKILDRFGDIKGFMYGLNGKFLVIYNSAIL